MPVPSLTLDLWSHILSYCVEAPAKKRDLRSPQRTLRNALLVNITFFLAAGPHLYNHIAVHEIDKLLLGANKRVSLDSSSFASTEEMDYETIRQGNTKLPLLRHMRRLVIIRQYTAPSSPFEENVAMSYYGLMLHVSNSVLNDLLAFYPFTSADSPVTPHLQSISVRKPPRLAINDILTPTPFLTELIELLLRALRPKLRCEHFMENLQPLKPGMQDLVAHLMPAHKQGLSLHELPAQVVLHAEMDDGLGAVWGTANRVVLRRRGLPVDVDGEEGYDQGGKAEKFKHVRWANGPSLGVWQAEKVDLKDDGWEIEEGDDDGGEWSDVPEEGEGEEDDGGWGKVSKDRNRHRQASAATAATHANASISHGHAPPPPPPAELHLGSFDSGTFEIDGDDDEWPDDYDVDDDAASYYAGGGLEDMVEGLLLDGELDEDDPTDVHTEDEVLEFLKDYFIRTCEDVPLHRKAAYKRASVAATSFDIYGIDEYLCLPPAKDVDEGKSSEERKRDVLRQLEQAAGEKIGEWLQVEDGPKVRLFMAAEGPICVGCGWGQGY
ncbi:hypothetical protein IAT38_003896 [Cryptococcus sp. DSM 104549]